MRRRRIIGPKVGALVMFLSAKMGATNNWCIILRGVRGFLAPIPAVHFGARIRQASGLSIFSSGSVKRRTVYSGWSSDCQKMGQSFRHSSSKKDTRSTQLRLLSNSMEAAETSATNKYDDNNLQLINLSTVSVEELKTVLTAWGHPKFRAAQVYDWIRHKGVTDPNLMNNLPKKLREQLARFSRTGSLQLVAEQVSPKDGTVKRAYRLGSDDRSIIESVLMPYRDGRRTACISSQAGCAQGCVFCATGQMGFQRQLTSDEIFEQVARYQALLLNNQQSGEGDRAPQRLTNIVFMGMGEPLANYRNVVTAIQRMQSELGIGARKITVSTVGIVPNIRKLARDLPQVRLAVSLHCANDAERSALLPANRRYGGLSELMTCLRDDYMAVTGKRITFEWALIAGQNDNVETARQLGRLLETHRLRRDMVHVNVIPLNPTGEFRGRASQREAVNLFCDTLQREFGVACTPRVRRGIDIDAGCGQLSNKLTAKLQQEQQQSAATEPSLTDFVSKTTSPPVVGVYEDDGEGEGDEETEILNSAVAKGATDAGCLEPSQHPVLPGYSLDGAVDTDWEDFEDPEYSSVRDGNGDTSISVEQAEANRLISLVQGTSINLPAVGDKNGSETSKKKKREKKKKPARNTKQIVD